MKRAGRREWIGLAVIALPCMLYSMDLTVLNLAVPALSADLQPSSAQLLWIVDIYGFLVAGSLITMGTLGDRIGRRKLLLIGAAAFGIASVLAAFSTSVAMLIAARALQGVAAATLAPSTLSLIRNMFLDQAQRTVAISVWIMSYSVGAAIGPLIGGVLLEHFWWGSVFLINVPVMLLLLAVGPALLPEFRDPDAGRLDPVSAVQSLAAVLAVIYGLKRIAEGGLGWIAALSIVAGVVVGVAFLRRQGRMADPLIDLKLFRIPAFSAALAVNILGFLTAFASFLFIAQFLQSVLGLSPLQAGLWGLPSALSFIAGSTFTPMIVRRFRPAYVIAGGMAVSRRRFRPACADRRRCVPARHARSRIDRVLAWTYSRGHVNDRHRPECRPEGARRGRRRALGNQLRVRRCFGHCGDGQHRHRHLSWRDREYPPRRRTGGGRRGCARHDWRSDIGRGSTTRRARRRASWRRPRRLRASIRDHSSDQCVHRDRRCDSRCSAVAACRGPRLSERRGSHTPRL